MTDWVWVVPALPLAGAVAMLVAGKPLRRIAGGLASALVGLSFAMAVAVFVDLLSFSEGSRTASVRLFEWISVGSFQATVKLRDDPRYSRYFAYMNLFVFSMLTLVLADNFALLYVGWEGVGLCSYLLIAFWFDRKRAADAGKKAFIVTRIGDTAMLIGIFLIFATFGSVGFDEVLGAAGGLASGTATAI